MPRLAILVGVLLGGCPLRADEGGPGRWPVPAGARVAVEVDKATVFLGENVVLHFVVENLGPTPFRIFTGCDGRNGVRALRFKVAATDEAGRAADDPHPAIPDFGGLGQEFEVAPGKKHYEAIPLHRYRRLDRPGTYTVRVWHDLGWAETEARKTPAAEVTLTVRLPDPEQARRVVAAMDRLKDRDSVRPGARAAPYPDYTTFQHPVYLPIFAPQARDADPRALRALGSIADPEATRAIIGLLDHKDPATARAALAALTDRLPEPGAEKRRRGQERAWLVEKAWRPSLAPAVRRAGRALLDGKPPDLRGGAFLLLCVGEQADLPALVRGLDAAVARARTPTLEDSGAFELWHAGLAMADRGVELPWPPRSPGERLLFARAIGNRLAYQPAGWEQAFAGLLRDDLPCVRKAALDGLPDGPGKALAGCLPDLLRDPDLVVRTAACWACLKVRSKDLEQPLLGVLATAGDDRLLYAAHTVAHRHGLAPRVNVLWVLAGRLDEPGMARICLKYLRQVVEGRSDLDAADDPRDPYCLPPAEAAACRRAWRKFLRDREKELAAGKTYPFDDPGLPVREQFPRVRFWRDR